MSSLGTRHPSDEQLLHFADGEMTTPQSEAIRGHLKACWQCRNELEEIERTISDCVRYRKVVLDTCLPPPPAPWFDIYPRPAAACRRVEQSQAMGARGRDRRADCCRSAAIQAGAVCAGGRASAQGRSGSRIAAANAAPHSDPNPHTAFNARRGGLWDTCKGGNRRGLHGGT